MKNMSTEVYKSNIMVLVGGDFYFDNYTSARATFDVMEYFVNNIKDFDYGWRGNMEYVFGKNWKFAWISPLITSPLPSDGIEHKRKGTMEEVKDI